MERGRLKIVIKHKQLIEHSLAPFCKGVSMDLDSALNQLVFIVSGSMVGTKTSGSNGVTWTLTEMKRCYAGCSVKDEKGRDKDLIGTWMKHPKRLTAITEYDFYQTFGLKSAADRRRAFYDEQIAVYNKKMKEHKRGS